MIAFLIISILLILGSIGTGVLSVMSQNKTVYDFRSANEKIRKAKADLSTSNIKEYALRRREYYEIVGIHNKALSDQSQAKSDAHMWFLISIISGVLGASFFAIYFIRLPEDAFQPAYYPPPRRRSPYSRRR